MTIYSLDILLSQFGTKEIPDLEFKEIEENNTMGRTRDLFKNIRDTKGTFHEKMGTIKNRKGMDLTEAEDIKKRWQEYTEELYKKHLNGPDNHDGVLTHLEPDILQCYDQPRQHIKKQRYYFANKGPSSQSYGFFSGHVWM